MKSKDQQLLEEAYKKVCEGLNIVRVPRSAPKPPSKDQVEDSLWDDFHSATDSESKYKAAQAIGTCAVYYDKVNDPAKNTKEFWTKMSQNLSDEQQEEVDGFNEANRDMYRSE